MSVYMFFFYFSSSLFHSEFPLLRLTIWPANLHREGMKKRNLKHSKVINITLSFIWICYIP